MIFLAGRFSSQWKEVSAEVDVPEGTTRLERINFYRARPRGKSGMDAPRSPPPTSPPLGWMSAGQVRRLADPHPGRRAAGDQLCGSKPPGGLAPHSRPVAARKATVNLVDRQRIVENTSEQVICEVCSAHEFPFFFAALRL